MDGHSKGKGPLRMHEKEETKQKKCVPAEKIGLIEGGYVLARPNQTESLHLAQIAERKPIKSNFQIGNFLFSA